MLDRLSGKILHIDFGDCFEVSVFRSPQKARLPDDQYSSSSDRFVKLQPKMHYRTPASHTTAIESQSEKRNPCSSVLAVVGLRPAPDYSHALCEWRSLYPIHGLRVEGLDVLHVCPFSGSLKSL